MCTQISLNSAFLTDCRMGFSELNVLLMMVLVFLFFSLRTSTDGSVMIDFKDAQVQRYTSLIVHLLFHPPGSLI